MIDSEVVVEIPGYPGWLVSSDGYVLRATENGPYIIRGYTRADGLERASVQKSDGSWVTRYTRDLIGLGFLGEGAENATFKVLDGDQSNVRLDNIGVKSYVIKETDELFFRISDIAAKHGVGLSTMYALLNSGRTYGGWTYLTMILPIDGVLNRLR